MQDTASATIDLDAVRGNYEVVRALCPKSQIMAMVKCDAYGHGLLPVAKALSEADGLAVARLKDALALRASGVEQRILLVGTLLDGAELATCSRLDIDVTAYDEHSVSTIVSQARRTPLTVWLELDSGMRRLGLDVENFVLASKELSRHAGIRELVHSSHFSHADEEDDSETRTQLSLVAQCRARIDEAIALSVANSAALLRSDDFHADWVRPGIMLYGDNPVGMLKPLELRTAMTLRSKVIAIRTLKAGDSVGYGGNWTAERPSRIATVGLGYGDGYPRHAPNGTPVWVNGRCALLAGRVSMDSLTIDVTDIEGCGVGDDVVLWGSELPVASVAKYAGTISYELLTSAGRRVRREYSGSITRYEHERTRCHATN